jgi:hypothetical protein
LARACCVIPDAMRNSRTFAPTKASTGSVNRVLRQYFDHGHASTLDRAAARHEH